MRVRMMPSVEHKKYLAKIGRKGGKSTSDAKAEAARKNAAKPRKRKRKYPLCAGGYANGAHRFRPDGRCYSEKCRVKYPDLRRINP